MKLILSLVAALALTGPSFAQDDKQLEAASQYMSTPLTQQMFDEMFSVDAIISQMGMEVGDITPEQMEAIEAIVAEELQQNRPVVEEDFAVGMAEVLSLGEIVSLTDFQTTNYGATGVVNEDRYFNSTIRDFAPGFQDMQRRAYSRIRDVLKN